MVARRAQRAANRKKHLQIKKTTSPIWQHMRYKCSQHNQRKKSTAKREKKHLQIKKTISSTWQHMHCKCSQHNQTKKRAANKIIYLFVLWAFAPLAVKLMKMFSWFAGAVSVCMCFLKLQRVELSRPP